VMGDGLECRREKKIPKLQKAAFQTSSCSQNRQRGEEACNSRKGKGKEQVLRLKQKKWTEKRGRPIDLAKHDCLQSSRCCFQPKEGGGRGIVEETHTTKSKRKAQTTAEEKGKKARMGKGPGAIGVAGARCGNRFYEKK